MTREQAERLEKLLDSGYLVLITDHHFVDSPVNYIGPIVGEDDDNSVKCELCYSSEVFTYRPLAEVDARHVSVYKPAMDEWPENKDSIERDKLDSFEYADNPLTVVS